MDDIARKYLERLNAGLDGQEAGEQPRIETRHYQEFKEQYQPKHLNVYERLCNGSAKLMSVSPDPKERPKIEEAIRVCHLNTTPEGVASFAFLGPMLIIILVAILSYGVPIMLAVVGGDDPAQAGSLFVLVFGVILGGSMIIPLQRYPYFLANSWRMKASNQMVLCTFYIVTYMRHTSNLELAIDFAGDHLAPPLSLDMKKVLWDVETQRYDSIKESLDAYLFQWREHNPEFIEAMHLIEGSLLENADSRRLEMLDKSLSVMLEETYEKMLHYAHGLKSPLTTLHMLGVILPILGLVILPLMVNFMPEMRWYYMALVYNVALPGIVFVLAKQILSTRPTGYGSADMTEIDPSLKRLQTINIPLGGKDELRLTPMMLSMFIIIGLLLVATLPLIYHLASPGRDWIYDGRTVREIDVENRDDAGQAQLSLLEFRLQVSKLPMDPDDNPRNNGPFGMGAVVLSLCIPLAFGLGIGVYYGIRSRRIIAIREETRKLEQEFASALFQLGNRLADGLPAEIAFAKVAEVLDNTRTATFFETVTMNITKLGMSVEDAVFDPKAGAIKQFPSHIIESSMKVLVESSKKGPLVASQAVINVSEYIKQMHRVDERLKDLLSEVISSMKSQINFLTPVIAGIVVGITSMISGILGSIAIKMFELQDQMGDQKVGFDIFGDSHLPTFHFQAIVGLYVVEITYILSVMVSGVENGADTAAEHDMIAKNMKRATLLYVFIAGTTIILFSLIAGNLVNNLG
jgi:hypothetical protein